jgi:hypothetical protein
VIGGSIATEFLVSRKAGEEVGAHAPIDELERAAPIDELDDLEDDGDDGVDHDGPIYRDDALGGPK